MTARRAVIVLAFLVLAFAASAAGRADATREWQRGAPLPDERTEVAAAALNGEIAVVGGFRADGSSSTRVDAYAPGRDRWRGLPDLPLGVNHAMAVGYRGRLYVVGGYAGSIGRGNVVRAAFVLDRGRWRSLPRPPEGRAAAGAAVVRDKLYVVGGVGPAGLARRSLVFDLNRRRWSTAPGPSPREHLAVTAHGGRVYALAGRLAGIDTNVARLESYAPGSRRWLALPPVPHPRGGTGAAAVGGEIVSLGGEEPSGTIGSVYAYSVARRSWRRLDDLPSPRHGLGVAALGGRVYAIAGGERPGLFVSGANEFLELG
jgi:kelch motif-containing protein/galactose oxidase-like protein/Kelch motif protein